MNEDRKKFIEDLKPKHVYATGNMRMKNYYQRDPLYIGLDGKEKIWEELSEEEKQDYLETSHQEFAKQMKTMAELGERLTKKYRERTRRIKNIC